MTPRAHFIVAAALLVLEYLLFSVVFDARELVPPFIAGIGQLAPMPVIVAVAFLILRTHAPAPPVVARALPQAVPALLAVAQLAAYAAFFATSLSLRAANEAGDEAPGLGVAWAALAALTALLLAAFALARAGIVDVARRAAAPLGLGAVVGALAWAAGRGTGELWQPLARLTLQPVAAIVRALSDDAIVDADRFVVGTERFSIRVDPVCSGYEGMGLVFVLLAAYVWTFRRALRFPHALALPLLAMAGAFFANVVRITALMYVGSLGAPEIAVGGFHSKAGWLLFCTVALGAVALARRAPFTLEAASGDARPAGDESDENPVAPWLVPLLALVAGSLFVGLASDGGLDHLELLSIAAGAVAVFAYRDPVRAALGAGGARTPQATWVGVLAGVLAFALWMALDDAPPEADAAIARDLAAWPLSLVALWAAGRVVSSVLLAPVVEELAFRGFLLRRLVAADFARVAYSAITPLALVVSSAAFGALHDRVVAGALAGAIYAATAWRTGRLRDAVIAHAVTNLLIAVVATAFGRWSLWG